MHGLQTIKRLNDQEQARVDAALRLAAQERISQPALSQTLAEYIAAKQQQYARVGF